MGVNFESSKEVFDAFEYINEEVFTFLDVLSCLKKTHVTGFHTCMSTRTPTKRSTPTPAKTVCAGGKTYQIGISTISPINLLTRTKLTP